MTPAIIGMAFGAAGVMAAIVAYNVSKKGWAYVKTWLEDRAKASEAKFAEKVKAALKDELAAIKAKVGI